MRRWILTGLAIAALMAGSASALIGGESDYNGQIKGDPYPGSSIAFNIKRTESGQRRVVDFVASGMAYQCPKGDDGDSSAISLNRGFRIRRDRSFGGKADATIMGFDPPARLKGQLRRKGRAVGTLRVHGELDPQHQPGVDCDTGRQGWRAKRGPRDAG